MSDLSKKFLIQPFSFLLNSFFFLSDLSCTAICRLNFLGRVPITSAVFSRTQFRGVIFQSCDNFGSIFVLFKILQTWLVLFWRMTLDCWPVIALKFFLKKPYSLTRAASFFLNTSYVLALDTFFFFFQLFLLRPCWPDADLCFLVISST